MVNRTYSFMECEHSGDLDYYISLLAPYLRKTGGTVDGYELYEYEQGTAYLEFPDDEAAERFYTLVGNDIRAGILEL